MSRRVCFLRSHYKANHKITLKREFIEKQGILINKVKIFWRKFYTELLQTRISFLSFQETEDDQKNLPIFFERKIPKFLFSHFIQETRSQRARRQPYSLSS